jgi:hypothetical protein
VITELEAADRRAEAVVRGLSVEQLNWRPRDGVWSVGQCVEHLRATNELYLSAIESAIESSPGSTRGTVDEVRPGWFSRWFMRNFAAPNSGGAKARAPKKIQPGSRVDLSVLAGFLASNERARDLVRRASGHDVNRIRFRNPFVPLLRFTAGAGLQIVAKHENRHLLQAEGVRQLMGSIA